MVRVFRCHCFASKQVIPVPVEPLMICAGQDKVFVATTDCEILVFEVKNGTAVEIQRLPTISQVERIIYNPFKNYIATIEKKKSWKKMTHSVRVYLNWESVDPKTSKPRTKVRVAGKSHVQHVSSSSSQNVMEIIEIPIDKHATGLAVCSQTGNFAVACGNEVRLCSVLEKTVGNSDKTYLDVETFLELCWNFPVHSIALCEEFVVCCSKTEVQGIRVRYDEGVDRKSLRRSLASPITSSHDSGSLRGSQKEGTLIGSRTASPYSNSPKSVASDAVFFVEEEIGGLETVDRKNRFRQKSLNSYNAESNKDLSIVARRQTASSHSRSSTHHILTDQPTLPVDDDQDNLVEWNFSQSELLGNVNCLPGLHSDRGRSQCHHHFQSVSPPVLSDFSGGKVKSSSGVQAETVLYLNDNSEKEDWMRVVLIPSYLNASSELLHGFAGTDRMTSAKHDSRTGVCCFVSGMRSGYLYQLAPRLNKVSTYQYTDKASQVSCGDQHLFVVTHSGIETYTSRWATLALESKGIGRGPWNEDSNDTVHPPSSLDTCLCGHEPFLGVVDMCAGGNFVALLSKMEVALSSDETVWSFYIVHSQNVIDEVKDMLQFADNIRMTGPSSYIHLLQEAHLLLSTAMAQTATTTTTTTTMTSSMEQAHNTDELAECLTRVKRLLGDVYAQPGEEGWMLCHSYYNSPGISIDYVVKQALELAHQKKPVEFGRGFMDFLDKRLFDPDPDSTRQPSPSTAEDILNIYSIACPEQLSRLILLSNLTGYKTETALQHLETWLAIKTSAGQTISCVDLLSRVQIQLSQCQVEAACSQLDSISTLSLVQVCCRHPSLVHAPDGQLLTALGQLMRWHRPDTMVEVLVGMLDRGLLSLDSLLVLLRSQGQSEIHLNSHVKQVLELILTDDKRSDIFEEAVNLLCEIYISLLKERKTSISGQFNQKTQTKFSSLQGRGYFAVRYGWLDTLPPFFGAEEMLRPCHNLEVKRGGGVGGKGLIRVASKTVSKSVTSSSSEEEKNECPCCLCHGNLLKLQSVLCSPSLTPSLARHILDILGQLNDTDNDDDDNNKGSSSKEFTVQPRVAMREGMDPYWDSVQLLCLIKLDMGVATQSIVGRYPAVVANFSSLCFQGDIAKYSFLIQSMETVLKKCSISPPVQGEQTYVKAYKELLTKMSELFPPAQFIQLLPRDGSLYFLLPYITRNLQLESTNSLKCDIIDMGKELLSQIG